MTSPRLAHRIAAAGCAASLVFAGVAFAKAAPAPQLAPEDDAVGELIGDLMFHADLLVALDRLCPAQGERRDWLEVVRSLPADARTPELRELSRRLSADAGRAMVRGSGGCATAHFGRAYAATRQEYEALLAQWVELSV